jgi:hypothetical protein
MIAMSNIVSNGIYAELAMNNPEALIPEGFDEAYIGFTVGIGSCVAVYDYDKCVEVLCKREGIAVEEAIEYLDFNTVFAHFGKNSPLYLVRK